MTGALLGRKLINSLGHAVGPFVDGNGINEGYEVGPSVGIREGSFDGFKVGVNEGLREGEEDSDDMVSKQNK